MYRELRKKLTKTIKTYSNLKYRAIRLKYSYTHCLLMTNFVVVSFLLSVSERIWQKRSISESDAVDKNLTAYFLLTTLHPVCTNTIQYVHPVCTSRLYVQCCTVVQDAKADDFTSKILKALNNMKIKIPGKNQADADVIYGQVRHSSASFPYPSFIVLSV